MDFCDDTSTKIFLGNRQEKDSNIKHLREPGEVVS